VAQPARVLSLEGKPKRTGKPQAAPKADRAATFKMGMTLALGCGIPLLSLAFSKIAGTLAVSHWPLALFAFVLMASVLAVSLPHLQWAIADVTNSGRWPSAFLAVALDLAIVLCETVITFAQDAGLLPVVYAVMGAVCIASMALNCWAFFKAPH
jgi:hypothetical protein